MGRFHLLKQEGYSIFSFGIKRRKRVDSIIPTIDWWYSFPEHKKGQYTSLMLRNVLSMLRGKHPHSSGKTRIKVLEK